MKIIEQNNSLIAEFMGAKTFRENKVEFSYEMYGIIQSIEDGEEHFFLPKDMLFSSDWNWLMEVVEKIEQNDKINSGFSQLCKSNLKENYWFYLEINHYKKGNYKKSVDGSTKIEAVYNACVDFIEWYNSAKEN